MYTFLFNIHTCTQQYNQNVLVVYTHHYISMMSYLSLSFLISFFLYVQDIKKCLALYTSYFIHFLLSEVETFTSALRYKSIVFYLLNGAIAHANAGTNVFKLNESLLEVMSSISLYRIVYVVTRNI